MTEWTVVERMAFRREQKLRLDKMLIQANDDMLALDGDVPAPDEKLSAEEIKETTYTWSDSYQKSKTN